MNIQERIRVNREFMKSLFGVVGFASDQQMGIKQPALQKPHSEKSKTVKLPDLSEEVLRNRDILSCFKARRSRRSFRQAFLSLQELSFLLWATQGVESVIDGGYCSLRTIPSAGARHPFETYLISNCITGLDRGIYRYLPFSHELLYLSSPEDLGKRVLEACLGQRLAVEASTVFAWCCIPYRSEWRYSLRAHKVMLLDAGHICQNLYLACEAIGWGTCAIGAYDQEKIDSLLGLDGLDEYTVYLAPVGKPH
jgi:SagB-type dehydrogenase family enzyme